MNQLLLHEITTWVSSGIALTTALVYFSRAKQVTVSFRSLGCRLSDCVAYF